ncbi:MAG: pyridoxamine 5'-phosphate oxidase family protein [Oscillospiraceae bacterium]|nr:pyridoxamine 5'-phosphate oxidase family protein [Oscillospiraceae bacterium]
MKKEINEIMTERFGKDSLISVATTEDGIPWVRTVDAYYEDGAFYCITHAASNKMRQIAKSNMVAVCGEWFSGHGKGENTGHVRDPKNQEIADKLRNEFASWYGNGHVDEDDPNTCILKITVLDGTLFSNGKRFDF